VAQELDKNELSRGLRRIIEFAAFCNQHFQQKQPWTNKERAKTCLYLSINATRALAVLLHPYLPFSTERLWQQLNLEGKVQEQNWKAASELAIPAQHQINQPKALFKKVEDQEIKRERETLQNKV
jgi:methionyl-tRNA synthetase